MSQMRYYTDEKNLQIIMALLKAFNIRKIITSPGTTNHTLVASMQNDEWFEMYSSVDERSAAYMACGLCEESGEPVVITCTEATASRNYMPGLTEAYYRKLPVLAITTTHGADKVGQHFAQVIDHSVLPNDIALYHTYIPSCHSTKDEKLTILKVNEALLELSHRGGGPVYLNVESVASRDYSTRELPAVRKLERFVSWDKLPELPEGKIGIFVGSHKKWSKSETTAIERFCEVNNAVIFCDHTSGYNGTYHINYSLVGSQDTYQSDLSKLRLLIHIGEVSGDYFSMRLGGSAQEVWRVNEDGKVRDCFGKLRCIFEMSEQTFFNIYSVNKQPVPKHIIDQYKTEYNQFIGKFPDLPLTKVWIASQVIPKLPVGSTIHFSILGSLRAGNFFELPSGVQSSSNVGGFGIDGATSTLIGASLANPNKLHFLMTGDLAFFYDLNAIGNRHVGKNVRICLVNNGDGTEFRMYWHPISAFTKEDADRYMAAGGHYGNKSVVFVKHMAEDLGFEYLTASNKEEFLRNYEHFLSQERFDKPMLFEVFTNSEEDNSAVHAVRNLVVDRKLLLKNKVIGTLKKAAGEQVIEGIKKIIR